MNTQIIRRRIRSITSTAQITKAMEMVAASKMKKAQEYTLRSRDYAWLAKMILGLLKKAALSSRGAKGNEGSHPLLKRPTEIKKHLIILITSDKGLCGSYNLAVIRKMMEQIQAEKPVSQEFVTLGKKGRDFLAKQKYPLAADFSPPAGGLSTYPTSAEIAPIVKLATQGFIKNHYQKVSVGYTDFVSTLKQTPQLETILPVSPRWLEKIPGTAADQKTPLISDYKFEPSQKEILDFILPRLMEVAIFQLILESRASEHSARMMAMKNATDNAQEIIKDLQLTYNSLRQATITQELAEISGGAAALN